MRESVVMRIVSGIDERRILRQIEIRKMECFMTGENTIRVGI